MKKLTIKFIGVIDNSHLSSTCSKHKQYPGRKFLKSYFCFIFAIPENVSGQTKK